MTPFLLDQEIMQMCKPLRQPAAIRRYLKRVGLPFMVRPDGWPLVSRQAVTQFLDGQHSTVDREIEPDMEALMNIFNKRRRADG